MLFVAVNNIDFYPFLFSNKSSHLEKYVGVVIIQLNCNA